MVLLSLDFSDFQFLVLGFQKGSDLDLWVFLSFGFGFDLGRGVSQTIGGLDSTM